MGLFILRRFGVMLLTALCLTFVVFFLTNLYPNLEKLAKTQGNQRMSDEQVANWLENRGYAQPLLVKYGQWLGVAPGFTNTLADGQVVGEILGDLVALFLVLHFAKPLVARQLKPGLLGRIVTIPYYPLSPDMIGKITRLQLERIVKRVAETHDVPVTYTDEVVETIVSRCQELESGGRMIDAIVTNTMLPDISAEFLRRMMEGKDVSKVDIDVKDGEFVYAFE